MVVKNTSSVSQIPQLFVVTANSGFFESIRGSSRIIKGVLSEQDIISAPVAPEMTRETLQRAVGAGGGFFGNMLSKIKAMASNPYVQGAVKGAVSGAMEHHKKKGGDGGTGGATSGAGGGLSRRLM
jgi:hypothetical protein